MWGHYARYSRCFPESATAQREDGRKVRMKDLKVGDRVLTLDRYQQPTYSEVTMMMHRQTNVTVADYIRLTTHANKTLTLSMYHLIPVSQPNSSRTEFIFTKDVRPHFHRVLVYEDHGGGGGSTSQSLVTSVEMVERRGAYAPLTNEGTIVVDDVYASCYASFPYHWVAHYVFYLWRTLYVLFSRIIDLSIQGDGFHWYPNFFRTALNAVPVLPYQL